MSDQPVAIITGAGGSVGQATALLLASAGYRLMLTSRTQGKLEATRDVILQQHPQCVCHILAADLTNPDEARRVIDNTVEQFERIDALAAVAGDAPMGSIDEITPELWQRTIDANVSYVMHMTARAWPIFQRQQSGVIAAVSSMASLEPFPDFPLYAPAKSALNMFIRCAAAQGEAFHLRSVAIAPGAIETPMLRGLFGTDMIPQANTLDPAEVAQLLVDCITGKRDFENGQTIAQPNP